MPTIRPDAYSTGQSTSVLQYSGRRNQNAPKIKATMKCSKNTYFAIFDIPLDILTTHLEVTPLIIQLSYLSFQHLSKLNSKRMKEIGEKAGIGLWKDVLEQSAFNITRDAKDGDRR